MAAGVGGSGLCSVQAHQGGGCGWLQGGGQRKMHQAHSLVCRRERLCVQLLRVVFARTCHNGPPTHARTRRHAHTPCTHTHTCTHPHLGAVDQLHVPHVADADEGLARHIQVHGLRLMSQLDVAWPFGGQDVRCVHARLTFASHEPCVEAVAKATNMPLAAAHPAAAAAAAAIVDDNDATHLQRLHCEVAPVRLSDAQARRLVGHVNVLQQCRGCPGCRAGSSARHGWMAVRSASSPSHSWGALLHGAQCAVSTRCRQPEMPRHGYMLEQSSGPAQHGLRPCRRAGAPAPTLLPGVTVGSRFPP